MNVKLFDIVGQDKIIDSFRSSIEKGKLSHAYLIRGEKGLGKKLLARNIAAMIMCKDEAVDSRPCGKCSSCIKLLTGNHPDVHIFSPDKKEYTVEQLEEIQEVMRRRPNESEKSIFIFEDGDSMSVSFQNKFLKILEEPPESVIIFVIADNSERLLETTLSRLRALNAVNVSKEECRSYIERKFGKSDSSSFAVEFSNDNIGRAIELLEDEDFRSLREEVVNLSKHIARRDEIKLVESLEYFEEKKDFIEDILDIMMIWFRDLLIYSKTREESFLTNLDKFSIIKEEAAVVSDERIYFIIEKIEDTKWRLNQNANYSSALSNFIVEISAR